MWTYRARITDVIDDRTVMAEVDLGFNIRTKEQITLAEVPAASMPTQAAAQVEAWVKDRTSDDPWPFILTLERVTWRDFWELHERYIGTVTTLNGESLNEHMIRWDSDTPF